jgi:hypothetical protein
VPAVHDGASRLEPVFVAVWGRRHRREVAATAVLFVLRLARWILLSPVW